MRVYNFLLLFFITILIKPSYEVSFIPENMKDRFGDALEAIFGMGVRLQALLRDKTTHKSENFIVSPLSASLVIGQLMLGAEGEFQKHLYELLKVVPKDEDTKNSLNIYSKNGVNSSRKEPYMNLHLQLGPLLRELKKGERHYILQSANALFINWNIRLNPKYVYEVNALYETEIRNVNFKSAHTALTEINQWASDHTKGLIKTILPSPPGPGTASILANAIYFLGDWETPFSVELNSHDVFTINPGKTTNVDYMMNLIEGIPFAESQKLNCKMVVLPYTNREMGMYVVLPNEGHKYQYNIESFANGIAIEDFMELMEGLKNRDVMVKIPKLTLSTSLSILKPLQKYAEYKRKTKNVVKTDKTSYYDLLKNKVNAYEAFNGTDFSEITLSGAALNMDLYVSDILQQMTFAINEKGTEAAVVTAGLMDYSGGAKNFIAKRPFLFFIRHEATGATIFWGTISNPNA